MLVWHRSVRLLHALRRAPRLPGARNRGPSDGSWVLAIAPSQVLFSHRNNNLAEPCRTALAQLLQYLRGFASFVQLGALGQLAMTAFPCH